MYINSRESVRLSHNRRFTHLTSACVPWVRRVVPKATRGRREVHAVRVVTGGVARLDVDTSSCQHHTTSQYYYHHRHQQQQLQQTYQLTLLRTGVSWQNFWVGQSSGTKGDVQLMTRATKCVFLNLQHITPLDVHPELLFFTILKGAQCNMSLKYGFNNSAASMKCAVFNYFASVSTSWLSGWTRVLYVLEVWF